MKKYFKVTFEKSENLYCANIAHAESVESVKAHYSKYAWADIEECDATVVEEAERRHKPIVEIETPVAEAEVQDPDPVSEKHQTRTSNKIYDAVKWAKAIMDENRDFRRLADRR